MTTATPKIRTTRIDLDELNVQPPASENPEDFQAFLAEVDQAVRGYTYIEGLTYSTHRVTKFPQGYVVYASYEGEPTPVPEAPKDEVETQIENLDNESVPEPGVESADLGVAQLDEAEAYLRSVEQRGIEEAAAQPVPVIEAEVLPPEEPVKKKRGRKSKAEKEAEHRAQMAEQTAPLPLTEVDQQVQAAVDHVLQLRAAAAIPGVSVEGEEVTLPDGMTTEEFTKLLDEGVAALKAIDAKEPAVPGVYFDATGYFDHLGNKILEKRHPELFEAPKPDHSIRAHHKYGPSKLNHMDDCAGFRSSGESNVNSDEGTLLHEVIEALLQKWSQEVAETPFLTLVQLLEKSLPITVQDKEGKDVILDEGQISAVRDVLKRVDFELPGASEIYTEEKIVTQNPDGTEFNHGSGDLEIVFPDNTATLMDWKLGRVKVREAEDNLQGMNYALGLFQMRPYESIKVVFIQPRIGFVTEHTFYRKDMQAMYHRLESVIAKAEDPNSPLSAGDQCRYCAKRETCTELINYSRVVAGSYHNMPVPASFHGSEITDPQQMALAYLWVKRAEPAIEGIKKAAVAMAKEGFDLAVAMPNGQTIRFELHERNQRRQLGAAPLVYDALKHIISPEEFTACVDVRVGDLEKVASEAVVERAKAEGAKITKKQAVEDINNLLTDAGLLSRPDAKTPYLKEVVDGGSEPINVTE